MRSVKILVAAVALGVAACGSDEPGGGAATESSEARTLEFDQTVKPVT